MININCSECCKYEENGKCSLTHITISCGFIGYDSSCAYFNPRSTPPSIYNV